MRNKAHFVSILVLGAICFGSFVNPCRGQSSPPVTKMGPCSGCNLPPGLTERSELPAYSPDYMGMNSICGDDAISRIICQPSAKYTHAEAKSMCEEFRARQIPNLKINVGASLVGVEAADLQWYCNRYFPLP